MKNENGNEIGDENIIDELRRLEETLKLASPERRAYLIIKSFFEIPDEVIDENVRNSFFNWLLDGKDQAAKDKAMYAMFSETV